MNIIHEMNKTKQISSNKICPTCNDDLAEINFDRSANGIVKYWCVNCWYMYSLNDLANKKRIPKMSNPILSEIVNMLQKLDSNSNILTLVKDVLATIVDPNVGNIVADVEQGLVLIKQLMELINKSHPAASAIVKAVMVSKVK